MPEPLRHYDRLAGKVAIVTGAGAEGDDIGIGRSIALLMGAEGARIVCADLDPARAQTTAERIEAKTLAPNRSAIDARYARQVVVGIRTGLVIVDVEWIGNLQRR